MSFFSSSSTSSIDELITRYVATIVMDMVGWMTTQMKVRMVVIEERI